MQGADELIVNDSIFADVSLHKLEKHESCNQMSQVSQKPCKLITHSNHHDGAMTELHA